MNSKERAIISFSHKEPDRVPIFELTVDNPTAEYILGRPALCGFGGNTRGVKQNNAIIDGKFYEYQKTRLADQLELWKKLEIDVFPGLFPIPRNPLMPEPIAENLWKFSNPDSGFWGIYEYSPDSDVYDQVNSSLKVGGLAALEELTVFLENQKFDPDSLDFSLVDEVIDRFGNELMLLGEADVEIGSTFDWAETFLIGLVDAPDLIHRYLDARLKITLQITEMLLIRGVHGIHGGYDWAANKGPIFSPRHFRKFVFPRLKQITDLCHRFGVPFIKHTDGNVNMLLDDMVSAGVDGFQAIEPRAGMNIAQVKNDYGDRLTLIGNVDCSTVLVNGPEEAVRDETLKIIQTAGPGGGFLLSSSNSIHPGVKPAYYLAMLDTARQAGKYPIMKKDEGK
jgi:hypothetical protein